MREIKYTGFNNEKWLMSIDFNGNIQVTCNDETRTYKINEPINKIEHDTEYVYIYVNDTQRKFYQFKFEIDSFFVGDIFDKNDEHLDTFASHVFGE